ncbi:MAG: sigma-70 family RNA polymerase sigma factor [Planctomycetota bacterium]
MTSVRNDVQRLLDEEPFVRSLARSLVSGDADDIVQQTFLRALEQDRVSVLQPRRWLARIVQNLATDERRRRTRREVRHNAAAAHELVPSSAELLEGEECRRALIAAVDALPAPLRTVVLLRYYEGLPPRRIAARLLVPVTTVSNRLHTALQTLRARLDASHRGDRRAWLLPLVPFATAPRSLPWSAVTMPASSFLSLGVIAMTMKTKVAAAAVALFALTAVWLVWSGGSPPSPLPRTGSNPAVAAASSSVVRKDPVVTPDGTGMREPAALAAQPVASTGSLVVHVRYADPPEAAAGLQVIVSAPGGDLRIGQHRSVNDADGTARFDGLAGALRVRTTVRPTLVVSAEISPGASCECTLRLEGGMTLSGIVVDPAGVPVGGALLEGSLAGISGMDAEQIAVSAADGTFVVRECETFGLIGARAAGYAASQLYFRQGKPGSVEHVRIELLLTGGCVQGVVLGPTGDPVANAVVRAGEGRTEAIMSTPQGAAPLPAQVRTDAEGRFLAVGVPTGSQPLQVRASGFAPWGGRCEVAAGSTCAVRVMLKAGVTCTGVVRGEDGQPVAGVDVTLGERGEFVQLRTRTADDGTFVLTGLPTGESMLAASKHPLGKAKGSVQGRPGDIARCDLQLSNGLALRGRVIDDVGAPVAGAEVFCQTEQGEQWAYHSFTDKSGSFLVADCPPNQLLGVRASARGRTPAQRTNVDPRAGELELRLARDTATKARITGRLQRPDGAAAAGETVEALRYQPRAGADAQVAADGSFATEVAAGEWSIRIQVKGHPEIRVARRNLEPGASWDLGVLQLTRGGTLVVQDGGEPHPDYLVVDANERFVCGLYSPVPPLRSELLAPGDYVLLARGEGLAAQGLPFSIRTEQETALEVQRPTGVRQTLEFAGGTADERRLAFEVRREGRLVLWDSARTPAHDGLAHTIWLAPGSYTLSTRDREPRRSVAFTVGEVEGTLVRLSLR